MRRGASTFGRIAFVLCTSVLSLGSSRVTSADEIASPNAKVANWDFAQWCQVGTHRFTLEKTTLSNIINILGNGKLSRDGDAGAAVYQWFVSYRWNDEIVTFSSNNDMGGPTHDLEEVDIKPATNASEASELPIIQGPIRFPFGELHMPFQELQNLLGQSPLVNGYLEYQFPGHIKGKDYEGKTVKGDVSGWLRVKIVGARVDQIQVSRITSY